MKKYRHYYNKQPSPLEMLIEMLFTGVFLLGKLIFKLIQNLFLKAPKVSKDSYEINKLPRVAIDEPINNESSSEKRYGLKESLLTPSEKNFLSVLEQVVGDSYIIEKQVQLSRIVTPTDSDNNFVNYKDFNQIKAKSIDFVLFNKDYSPYLCIELDDLSHMRWNRQKRDVFVDKIMEDVGLRIIHIRASNKYGLEELKKTIFNYEQGNI